MPDHQEPDLKKQNPLGPPDYDWQVACFEAFSERDEEKIPQRIRDANAAIQARLSRLEPWPDGREITALNEAVQRLRELRNQYPQ